MGRLKPAPGKPAVGRVRTAVLISGRGSNLGALLEAAAAPDYPAEIALVVSDRAAAGGLALAAAASVPTRVLRAMRDRLDVEMETLYCPHAAGPPVCWCRKPLPGLAVLAIERHRLDPRRCVFVGDGPQDPGLARRLRFAYRSALEFFGAE